MDDIIRRQVAALRPSSVVDFGAGGGKIGRICREVLGPACRLTAVEGFEPSVRLLRQAGIYDCIEHALIQQWLARPSEAADLAVFGDVLEHMRPAEIRRALRICLQRFRHVLVVLPLCHNVQEAVDGNELEIHRTYVTAGFFDRYRPVEKHIVRQGHIDGMNVLIDASVSRVSLRRRLPKLLFHLLMVAGQPFGLSRPLAVFARRHLNRWKWLIRC